MIYVMRNIGSLLLRKCDSGKPYAKMVVRFEARLRLQNLASGRP